MRLDLNAAAQGFLEHRVQLFGFFGEITGSFGRVTVWLQQRRAARAERAVKDHFERALREVVIVIVDGRSLFQKSLRIFPRPINRVDKAQFYFSLVETFSNYFDVVCIAAGVLNFAPAEFDLAIHCEKDRLLALSFSRLRNILRHQILRAIEQHSGRFTGRVVFQNFATERIWRLLADLRNLQRRAVRDCGVTVRAGKKYGIVGCDCIEILLCWKLWRFPKCFDPAAASDPFAGRGLRDARFHFGEKIFARVRPFEIQIHLALANSENVAMRIGQAGHNRFAAQIDNACFIAAKVLRVFV